MTVMNRLAIGEQAYETRLLIDRLSQLRKGETITYDELGKVIDADIRDPKKRHFLMSARRSVERSGHAVFDAVPNVGIKRLDDDGAAEKTTWFLGAAKRRSKRALETASRVEIDQITSPTRQRTFALSTTIAGCLSLFFRPETRREIGRALIDDRPRPASPELLAALFGEKHK